MVEADAAHVILLHGSRTPTAIQRLRACFIWVLEQSEAGLRAG